MRFAFIATSAAAAMAAPFVMAATGPQMSDEEFLAAVRCTAYESVAHPDASLAEAKWRLNSEARRQPVETAVLAEAEAKAAARQAVSGAGAVLAASCSSQVASDASTGHRV